MATSQLVHEEAANTRPSGTMLPLIGLLFESLLGIAVMVLIVLVVREAGFAANSIGLLGADLRVNWAVVAWNFGQAIVVAASAGGAAVVVWRLRRRGPCFSARSRVVLLTAAVVNALEAVVSTVDMFDAKNEPGDVIANAVAAFLIGVMAVVLIRLWRQAYVVSPTISRQDSGLSRGSPD
jgi:hypothetical protein